MKLSPREGNQAAEQLDPLLQLRDVRYVCVKMRNYTVQSLSKRRNSCRKLFIAGKSKSFVKSDFVK